MILRPSREGWIDGLLDAAGMDERILLLDADVSRSIGGERFAARFPDRHFNLGVSEQEMLSEAAGLALAGFIPYVQSYAVFCAGRAWEQIRTGICHMNLAVRIGGAHAGLSAGPDGATHQALEDVGIMRVLPNMRVLVPADAPQARAAAIAAASMTGPVYIRFGRNPSPVVYPDDCLVEPGGADVLLEGEDVLLVAAGPMVAVCLEASGMLSRSGIRPLLVNAYSIKPLAEDLLVDCAHRCGRVVVAMDHQEACGLFGAVAELLARRCPVPVEPVCARDRFGTSGSPEQVSGLLGLTAGAVAGAALRLCGVPSR
jgi:transketolase